MSARTSEQAEEKHFLDLMKVIEGMVIRAGIAPAKFIPALRKNLRSNPDSIRALNNYHRFLTSGFSESLLFDFANHPILQKLFLEITGQSQYLADILVRNPELLRWLTATNELTKAKTYEEYFREAQDTIKPFERIETKLNALKRFHRREILRLGVREILGEAESRIITGELSFLADAIIETVLQVSIEELSRYIDLNISQTLAVIGLGKLGGEELNFSSDIDLMFVYDEDGKLSKPVERMSSLHEYYVRLSEIVVRHLIERTSEGYFYRVDMRLRPYGSSGLLAMSRASYRSYYEAQGEVWERQMLLKARIVAGNKSVGTQWLIDLKPFIFPKSLTRSPVEEIATIKEKIEKHITGEENIKLGAGGIRDIEFVVQALQLLNAGSAPTLVQNNSLHALEILNTMGFLSNKEATDLENAYRFLRKVEHRLQLLYGLQTHSLPETSAELLSLAKRLGYSSKDKFIRELEQHRRKVRVVFRSVFYPESLDRKKGKRDLDGEIAIHFKQIGFKDSETARRNLHIVFDILPQLREPSALRTFSGALREYKAADWGLQNFVLLTTSEPIRRTLTAALSNPKVIKLIVCIVARSRRMTTLLVSEPLLFESLVSQSEELINGDMQWNFLIDSDPIRFKLFTQFTIMLQWLMRKISVQDATRRLSDIAQKILTHMADEVYATMFTQQERFPISIVAMGKLGGRELSLDSDLDVVFMFDAKNAGEQQTVAQSTAEKFARSVLKKVTSESGKVYDVDVRLRPEGKNAPLTSDIDYLRSYLKHRASLWERQALIRARVVWGDAKLSEKIYELLQEAVYSDPLPSNWKDEIQLMRHKIEEERKQTKEETVDLKTGPGGILDVEFTAQVLQMSVGRNEIDVRVPNAYEAIEMLKKHKMLKESEAKMLVINYERLRCLELLLGLNSEGKGFAWPPPEQTLPAIAAGMGQSRLQALKSQVSLLRKKNRQLYSKIIRRYDTL